MKISLEEYVQATRVAVAVEDAPMTALPGIKDAFVRLVESMEAAMPVYRDTSTFTTLEEAFADGVFGPVISGPVVSGTPIEDGDFAPTPAEVIYKGSPEIEIELPVFGEPEKTVKVMVPESAVLLPVEQDKPKRGRPKKTEAVAELPAAQEDKEPAGESVSSVPAAETPSPMTDTAAHAGTSSTEAWKEQDDD